MEYFSRIWPDIGFNKNEWIVKSRNERQKFLLMAMGHVHVHRHAPQGEPRPDEAAVCRARAVEGVFTDP